MLSEQRDLNEFREPSDALDFHTSHSLFPVYDINGASYGDVYEL